MIHLSPLSSRNQLPSLLANQKGVIVEVGVHRGEFTAVLAKNHKGPIIGIDHWSIPPGYERQATHLPEAGKTRDEDRRVAEWNLMIHSNVKLKKATSDQACRTFSDGSVELVYLDGDHERPGIDDDLRRWWPKVNAGGVLAAHDFLCPGEMAGGWGQYIQPALLEFAASVRQDVFLIAEERGMPWTAYLRKV